jgi:hypothetical protein
VTGFDIAAILIVVAADAFLPAFRLQRRARRRYRLAT